MSTYKEWAGSLYRTRAEMLDAIAEAWATACGHASPAETRRNFDEATDAELAAEAIAGWGLDQPRGRRFSLDDERPSHMVEHEYTAADLAEAFARLRARLGRPDTEAD
ncbi:hypothetical protein KO353_04465 [Elioraea tepida]|uniref:Uncharacterized protein n=1 Tax=Elioraea tepida TaxID=2843330 RepID=A0A975U347_9PROT|nr:hypothetical protein [Elioraea tepida]QXM25487.1 hypothetical protein KO353_04465 [Elioraea tepida]